MALNTTTTAASAEVSTHDGRTVTVGPITNRDIDRFEQWMRDSIVNAGKASIRDVGLTEPEMRIIMSEAYKASARCVIGSDEGNAMLNSSAGQLRLTYLSLRHTHPELTRLSDDAGIDLVGQTYPYPRDQQAIVNKAMEIGGLVSVTDIDALIDKNAPTASPPASGESENVGTSR